MDDFEPSWEFLPLEPEKFFDLPRDYDRLDLKRKYNKLIRKFKPEKFPEEFKKIRAAYEELEERLKYGHPGLQEDFMETLLESGMEEPFRSEFTIDSDDDQKGEEGEEGEEGEDPSFWEESFSEEEREPWSYPVLMERLQRENPQKIFEELKDFSSKTPFHYYTLAIMSEIYGEPPSPSFSDWILEGLKDHQDHEILSELFFDFWKREKPSLEEGKKILKKFFGSLKREDFFYLSRPLWFSLASETPFPSFRDLLEEYRPSSEADLSEGEILFYLKVLPRIFWKADEPWLSEKLSLLNQYHEWIPPFWESELDFLEILWEYRTQQQKKKMPGRFGKRLHQFIEDYCEKEEEDVLEAFLKLQGQIVQHPEKLLRDFPLSTEPRCIPYQWILQDFSPYREEEIEEKEKKPATNREQCWYFAKEVEKKTENSFYGTLWNFWGLFYLVLLFLCIAFPFFVFYGLFPQHEGIFLPLLLLVVWNLFFWNQIKENTVESLSDRIILWLAGKCYNSYWRRDVLNFLAKRPLSIEDLSAELKAIEDSELSFHTWISILIEGDEALHIYCQSLSFLP